MCWPSPLTAFPITRSVPPSLPLILFQKLATTFQRVFTAFTLLRSRRHERSYFLFKFIIKRICVLLIEILDCYCIPKISNGFVWYIYFIFLFIWKYQFSINIIGVDAFNWMDVIVKVCQYRGLFVFHPRWIDPNISFFFANQDIRAQIWDWGRKGSAGLRLFRWKASWQLLTWIIASDDAAQSSLSWTQLETWYFS